MCIYADIYVHNMRKIMAFRIYGACMSALHGEYMSNGIDVFLYCALMCACMCAYGNTYYI